MQLDTGAKHGRRPKVHDPCHLLGGVVGRRFGNRASRAHHDISGQDRHHLVLSHGSMQPASRVLPLPRGRRWAPHRLRNASWCPPIRRVAGSTAAPTGYPRTASSRAPATLQLWGFPLTSRTRSSNRSSGDGSGRHGIQSPSARVATHSPEHASPSADPHCQHGPPVVPRRCHNSPFDHRSMIGSTRATMRPSVVRSCSRLTGVASWCASSNLGAPMRERPLSMRPFVVLGHGVAAAGQAVRLPASPEGVRGCCRRGSARRR